AEVSFACAIERLKRIASARPDDVEAKRGLAAAYNNLAPIHQAAPPAEAAAMHRKAIELLQVASQAEPANLSLRRELGVTLNNLGAALSRAQQETAALAAYQQAIDIREELVRLAPARATYRTDLAVSRNNLGLLEERQGRSIQGGASFRSAIDLYTTHLKQFPTDALNESNLASVYSNLGLGLERRDDLQAAADAFAHAATHQSSAMASVPHLPRAGELLAKHRASESRVLQKLQEHSAQSQHQSPSATRKDVQPTSEINYTAPVSGTQTKSSLLSRTR